MPKLSKPVVYETTFGTYTVDEQIGEGGAGRVFGGLAHDGTPVAVKVLSNATSDKRARFKAEIAFLQANKHPHIVSVLDHGLTTDGKRTIPFYVMPRYEGSLRNLMRKGIPSADVMRLFSQILDGVEAAHLKQVIHRDLKPENVLYRTGTLAIADFGIARFTEDLLITLPLTGPTDRLANFMYAAPEQRNARQPVSSAADIYALGLILNEMFTGAVAHGTEYAQIVSRSKPHEYLDRIVERMIRNSPGDRPASLVEIKSLIGRYEAEAVSLQKISTIDQTVISQTAIDEPLAYNPPRLIDVRYDGGALILTLDRPVNAQWIDAFQKNRFSHVVGAEPHLFRFSGAEARISVGGRQISTLQDVINHFKNWLPIVSGHLQRQLEQKSRDDEQQRIAGLRAQREHEERVLQVNRSLHV